MCFTWPMSRERHLECSCEETHGRSVHLLKRSRCFSHHDVSNMQVCMLFNWPNGDDGKKILFPRDYIPGFYILHKTNRHSFTKLYAIIQELHVNVTLLPNRLFIFILLRLTRAVLFLTVRHSLSLSPRFFGNVETFNILT